MAGANLLTPTTAEFASSLKEIDPQFSTKIQVISRRYSKADAEKKEELEEATQQLVKCCVEVQE